MNKNTYEAGKRYDELNFALLEMRLFLDTHPGDSAALAIRSRFENEYRAARRCYIEECGPLTIFDGDATQWVKNPWPWDWEGCAC